MPRLNFDNALATVENGSSALGYKSSLNYLINELKDGKIDKDIFKSEKNEKILGNMIKNFSRVIEDEGELQFNFIKALVNHGYRFTVRYSDICCFENKHCFNHITYKFSTDPFDNTMRILKFLDAKVKLLKDIRNNPNGYEYPLKAAAEYLNFGFVKNLIKNNYTFEKEATFKSSPLPHIIEFSDDSILEEAFKECNNIKANFNVLSENGETLLHLAAKCNRGKTIIKKLVEEYKVDPKVKNKEGKTAYDVGKDIVKPLARAYLKNVCK